MLFFTKKITKENKKFKEQASQNLLKLATFVSDDEVAFQDLPFGTDQETSGSTQVKAVRMPAVTFPPKYVTWVNVAKLVICLFYFRCLFLKKKSIPTFIKSKKFKTKPQNNQFLFYCEY